MHDTTPPDTTLAPPPQTQTQTPDAAALLPLREVAARRGVRPSTARTWIRLGRLRGHRFGGRCYRVAVADLNAFIRACETVPPALPGEGVQS